MRLDQIRCAVEFVVLCVCLLTERLDEILASQESALRPKEPDYRAATVKQRPTSRRITPAEISVRHTHKHV